ncbi:MAG: hypothetical protein HY747_02120 [Elusimicrobia bacterium]|nr:hypothetical protein [Elusimicrobiota bacterium]
MMTKNDKNDIINRLDGVHKLIADRERDQAFEWAQLRNHEERIKKLEAVVSSK